MVYRKPPPLPEQMSLYWSHWSPARQRAEQARYSEIVRARDIRDKALAKLDRERLKIVATFDASCETIECVFRDAEKEGWD
jgi:hypothetical protein